MTNEYLFLSIDNRSTVEMYKPNGITVEISEIDNTILWIATYFIDGNSKNSADELSKVHIDLMQYAPLVLSCESSEYYNKMLFPLINELERKLRKLLYLAASISDNEKAKESIKQLEEKDFGTIFDLLFIDPNFINEIKKRINADGKSEFNGKSKYSKDEIKSYLDSLIEHTLWDAILSQNDVPTLRKRFRDVQTYRNDVMHAHNISKELFGKAQYLFDKINKELNIAITKLMGNSKEVIATQKSDVNTAISSAMAAMDISSMAETLSRVSLSPTVLEISQQMSKALCDIQPLAINTALTEAVKNIQYPMIQPAMDSIRQQLNELGRQLMQPYSLMAETLQSYSALQDSLHEIATTFLPNCSLKVDEENELKNVKSEEDNNSNEQQNEDGNP